VLYLSTLGDWKPLFDAGGAHVEAIELSIDLRELYGMLGYRTFDMVEARDDVLELMLHGIELPTHMTQRIKDKIFNTSAIISFFQTD
jgi:hypothetical protein